MKTIKIRDGDFRAEVLLDQLGELPIPKFRRLLRLTRGASEENQMALDSLHDYLNKQVETTKAAWETAGRKRAKAAYDRALKLQAIFEKEIN